MNEFPIGETLERGRWKIAEHVAGEPARGCYRAIGKDGRRALVTLAHYQKQPVDLAHYAMSSPRIAPLLYVGRLETTAGRYDGLLEEEPAGRPLRDAPPPPHEALAVVIDACAIVEEAHRRGIVLRGIRPELVYVEHARITAIAPRCEEFMSTSTPPSSGVLHPFSRYYLAPEILRLRVPTSACDVFSLGAILAELVTGEHPFEGDHIVEQLQTVVGNQRRPWHGPAELRAIVDRALDPIPDRRPTAGELAAALRGAGVSRA